MQLGSSGQLEQPLDRNVSTKWFDTAAQLFVHKFDSLVEATASQTVYSRAAGYSYLLSLALQVANNKAL